MARDLRLFYLFRMLATSYLWVPIRVFFMASRGVDFDEVMWLGGLYCAVVVLVEIPTGALADRLGRRESMMAGAAAMVASCLVAFLAHGFAMFAVAEALAAVSMSLCSGADSAYLFDLLHAAGRVEEYPRREGIASAWHLAGSALAYALGGLLGEVDVALPYLATAALSVMAFAAAMSLRPESRRTVRPSVRQEVGAYVDHMRAAVIDVRRSRRLIWLVAYSAVVFVLLQVTIYLYQPYLKARGFDLAQTGLVFAGVYLLASVVALKGAALRRALGEEFLLWALLGTLAVSFLLLDLIPGRWALVMLAVQAVANGLYSPLVKPMLNREIPSSERRASVLSIESIARRTANGMFSPVVGIVGAASAISLCGIVGLGGLVLLLLSSRLTARVDLGHAGEVVAGPVATPPPEARN